jgi:hypothetical protein
MSDIALDPAVAKVPEAAPRTAPISQLGLVGWLRANLFSSWINSAVTLLVLYFVVRWAIGFVEWGIVNAVWSVPNNQTQVCRDLKGTGACWAVITRSTASSCSAPTPSRSTGARRCAWCCSWGSTSSPPCGASGGRSWRWSGSAC